MDPVTHVRRTIGTAFALSAASWIAGLGLAIRGWALDPETAILCLIFLISTVAATIVLLRLRGNTRWIGEQVQSSIDEQSAIYRVDTMTGVLTRMAFIEECEAALRKLEKGLGFLVHFDLDFLKSINDTHGHAAGDFALKYLCKSARAADAAAIFGRLGGDEFAMFVAHRPPCEAQWLASEIQQHLQHSVRFEGHTLELSTSMGIAFVEDETTKIDELLHQADLALYASKRAGRSRATEFDDSMLRELRRIKLVERELRAAILLDELELDYQPLFDREGRLRSCEALVRWRHSIRGRIPPNEFIPIAERSKLIDKIGEWVLRRACSDFSSFADVTVSVNLSAGQLKRDEIVNTVRRVLKETGLPPHRLNLELTESMGLERIAEARERIERLRGLGVSISLDDFGAGHSGFAYLQSFPVDWIKIDRSFISKLGTSHASTVLVDALVNVAHSCQIGVVAEGIETAEQHRLARLAGADIVQGFHLSRPVSLKAIEKLVSPGTLEPPESAQIVETGRRIAPGTRFVRQELAEASVGGRSVQACGL